MGILYFSFILPLHFSDLLQRYNNVLFFFCFVEAINRLINECDTENKDLVKSYLQIFKTCEISKRFIR